MDQLRLGYAADMVDMADEQTVQAEVEAANEQVAIDAQAADAGGSGASNVPFERWGMVGAALLTLMVVAVYANSFSGVFLLDDLHSIVDNPAIQDLWPFDELETFERPLVKWTLALSYTWSLALTGDGLSPLGFHLFNTLVHLGSVLLFFDLMRRTVVRMDPLSVWRKGWIPTAIAFVAAAVWSVHPLNTQAVTYIIQRGESMMAMFFLLVLYGTNRSALAAVNPFTLSKENKDADAAAKAVQRERIFWVAVVWLAMLMGMMSKEVMATVAPLALLYDRAFLANSWKSAITRRWYIHAPLWFIALAGGGLTYFYVAGESAGFGGAELDSPWVYFLTQSKVLLHYMWLMYWPVGQSFDFGWPATTELGDAWWQFTLLILSLLGALVAVIRWPKAGFMLAGFFVVLAPTSSFLPIADRAAEHRMYLPLAFLIAYFVADLHRTLMVLAEDHRAAYAKIVAGLTTALVVILGTLTVMRNADYHSAKVMWQDVVDKSERLQDIYGGEFNTGRAHASLGQISLNQARQSNITDEQREEFLTEAQESYTAALEFDQGIPARRLSRLTGLAEVYMAQQDWQAARDILDQALNEESANQPHDPGLLNNSGLTYLQLGELQQAVDAFEQAIEHHPDYLASYQNLGSLLVQAGQDQPAAVLFNESLTRNPDQPAVWNALGATLARLGNLAAAEQAFTQAVNRDAGNTDYLHNLEQLKRAFQPTEN